MAKKNKGGARGKYREWLTDEGLLKLEGWARDGLTDEQIAHNIGIATGTLYTWKNKYDEIDEALKKGKEVIDRQVENALLKRALGYEYFEVTYETVEDQDGYTVEQVTKRVLKHERPDTTAQIFWLKNRKPEEWRDRHEVDHSGELNVKTQFENMSDAELKELANKYENINKANLD